MKNDVALVGYSGHGFVVGEAAIKQGYPLKYYVDKREVSYNPLALIYLGDEADDKFIGWDRKIEFVLGIGNNLIREKIARKILNKGASINNVIHPSAYLSDYCTIAAGNFVANNAVINTNAKVGSYTIINTACIVEHDCQIGDFCHIAPGAVLAGNVSVGSSTFIGANAIVKEGVRIGRNVVIGAGSVILRNIPDSSTVYGNPGKIIDIK